MLKLFKKKKPASENIRPRIIKGTSKYNKILHIIYRT